MSTGQFPAATPAAPDAVDRDDLVDRTFLAIAVELIAEGWPDAEPEARPAPHRTPPPSHCALGCPAGRRPGPDRQETGPGARGRRAPGARRPLPRERSPPGRSPTDPTPRGGGSTPNTAGTQGNNH